MFAFILQHDGLVGCTCLVAFFDWRFVALRHFVSSFETTRGVVVMAVDISTVRSTAARFTKYKIIKKYTSYGRLGEITMYVGHPDVAITNSRKAPSAASSIPPDPRR